MTRALPEPIRKAALINAAIGALGQAGSLDVTVARIARDAGMSPALAHHYFGSKDAMLLATMRAILARYGAAVRAALAAAPAGRRLDALIAASFAPENFRRDVVGAWLTLYPLALTDPGAARLLAVYHRRLRSNLRHALAMQGADPAVAEPLAALIDGVYLRAALAPGRPDPAAATALVRAAALRLA